MIIVSNYILEKNHFPLPAHVVVRINVAWVKTMEELERILEGITHDVYLDYPQGRSKPPRPTIRLEDVIRFAHTFKNVKYFAVSNVEDPEDIYGIQRRLPAHISIVPKIETIKGIENLEEIIEKIGAKYIMLDKEDLYVDVERDAALFEELIEKAREKTIRAGAEVLELHGVVFGLFAKDRHLKKGSRPLTGGKLKASARRKEVIQKAKEKAVPRSNLKRKPTAAHRA